MNTNSTGEKIHLNHIKNITRKNGGLVVSSSARRTDCGQINTGGIVESTAAFRSLAKSNPDACCKHCLQRLAHWEDKARAL